MPEVVHDAPLSEIWVTEKGHRHRVYRGDTQAHIDYKLAKYDACRPEIILVPPPKEGEPAKT